MLPQFSVIIKDPVFQSSFTMTLTCVVDCVVYCCVARSMIVSLVIFVVDIMKGFNFITCIPNFYARSYIRVQTV